MTCSPTVCDMRYAGMRGPDGDKGPIGFAGLPGNNGTPGIDGNDGMDSNNNGSTGPQGATGPAGVDGQDNDIVEYFSLTYNRFQTDGTIVTKPDFDGPAAVAGYPIFKDAAAGTTFTGSPEFSYDAPTGAVTLTTGLFDNEAFKIIFSVSTYVYDHYSGNSVSGFVSVRTSNDYQIFYQGGDGNASYTNNMIYMDYLSNLDVLTPRLSVFDDTSFGNTIILSASISAIRMINF